MVTGFIPLVNADLDGGGLIENAGPTVASIITHSSNTDGGEDGYSQLDGSPASCYNDDGDDYLIVRVCVNDTNGEDDLLWINITCNQDPTGDDAWMNHAITASDRSNTTPVSAELMEIHGWDNGTEDNGFLTFTFKYIYVNDDEPSSTTAASATWTWTAAVTDTTKNSDNANLASHSVYNYADIEVFDGYYAPAGSENESDTEWGKWNSPAGNNVSALNYLKATNDGTAIGQIQVDFDDGNLSNGSTNHIPLQGNISYYYDECVSPNVASWAYEGTGKTSTATDVTQGAASQVVSWYHYYINIPVSTPVGSYSEGFTWDYVGIKT